MDLVDHYALDPDEVSVELARRVLAASIEASREVVDFDDMLYMPVVAGAAFEQQDVVFLDEAQDVSGIQMEMVRRMVTGYSPVADPDTPLAGQMWSGDPRHESFGRVIAVGDRHQSCYGFRGAGTDGMDQIKRLFGCVELPLSVTYRCPRSVVRHSQQWVRHLEWCDAAEEGIVAGVEEPCEWELEAYRPGDAILCRINRPLVGMAFALIRRRIAAKVLGRDIGQGLVKLAEKLGKTVVETSEEGFSAAFSRRLDNYRRKESERLSRRRQDRATLASMHDRLDTLQVFVDQPDATDLRTLVRSIEELFGDNGQLRECVTLATVHKAKGQEWDRVFIVDAARWMPGPWATQAWEQEQERNIMYVAATRARRELRYVKSLEAER